MTIFPNLQSSRNLARSCMSNVTAEAGVGASVAKPDYRAILYLNGTHSARKVRLYANLSSAACTHVYKYTHYEFQSIYSAYLPFAARFELHSAAVLSPACVFTSFLLCTG